MIKLFYGNEPYRLEFERNKIKKAVGNMGYCECTAWDETIAQRASMQSIFASRNVIILRLDKLGADEDLLSYIKKENESTDLYIFADAVDKNTKVFKAIRSLEDSVVECSKLSATELQAFTLKTLKAENANMTQSAYELFVSRIAYQSDPECNLFVVENYVRQLAFLSKKIDVAEVEELVPCTPMEKSFILADYMLRKDGAKLFHAAKNLLQEGENVIGMLSYLLRTFRLAYKASLYPELKGKERNAKLGFSYGRFPETNCSTENLKDIMDTLQNAVNSIKRGMNPDKVFMLTLAEVYERI